MSGGGGAVVRRLYDAVNRNTTVEGAASEIEGLIDPEVEFVNPEDAIERGTRLGHGGMRTVLENLYAGVGPEAEFEIEELLERDDLVFVVGAHPRPRRIERHRGRWPRHRHHLHDPRRPHPSPRVALGQG